MTATAAPREAPAGEPRPPVGGGRAVWLVARRELVERVRERSFAISTAVSLLIIVMITVLPNLLGFGGTTRYELGVTDDAAAPVAQAAARNARAFDAEVAVRRVASAAAAGALAEGELDAVLGAGTLRAQDEPDEELLSLLQAAQREAASVAALRRAGLSDADARAALAPPPLRVSTAEPVDEQRERRGGFAFVAVLLLYGQLIGYGFFVAMGVVEEKSSRVVEILLAAIRPRELLAGKVLGLGLLGLGQLLLFGVLGLTVGALAGALDVTGDILVAAGLALAWFVVGYAFYACAFACAAALVPRQEELQSATTPLTLVLLVSFFVSFAALNDPDGTIARVASFVPTSAPMVMPTRIALGEASALEVLAAFALTLGAAAALIPLAARIYAGAILRTGATVKLREAWRARA